MEKESRGIKMPEFGLRWQEFNRNNEIVTKEKFFATAKGRGTFMQKLIKKDNFYRISATCN